MDRFLARASDIVIQEFDGGLVIYDGREAQAHWLDPSATAVWRACHEPRTEAEIADAAGLDGPRCEILLSQLIELGLVDVESGSGYSRRVVLRTAAKVGLGGAIAAPIISTFVPTAAAAGSGSPPPPPPPPSPPAPPLPPGPTTHCSPSGVTATDDCQTTGADLTFVPGAPTVSGVTVIVGRVSGTGGGKTKHSPPGFSITRASANRDGVIVLTLSARTAGAFAAHGSVNPINVWRKKHGRDYGSGSAVLVGRGSVMLRILPTMDASRALAEHRQLEVSITITFKPPGDVARAITVSLKIKLDR